MLPESTPEFRRGLAFGQVVGGMIAVTGGLAGEVGGGALSVTGIGAALGVPAMVVSTGVVLGGLANVGAGVRGLMTTGSGNGSKVAPNIDKAYRRPSGATTRAQRASVQGKPCVDCGDVKPTQVADHKTPLVDEYYGTGAIDKTRMRDVDAVQPQCPTCSARQGASRSQFSKEIKKLLGL